jgi:hypothetical protein
VPAGDPLGARREAEITRAIRAAQDSCGLTFSVYLGPLGADPASRAGELHAQLEDAASSVLVAVDPQARAAEVVVGHEASRLLDDRAAGLGCVAMTPELSAGDITGGVVNGLRTLAEHARHPRVLHRDQP